ncbi:hypothetical protein DL770_004593 [Monosporascus sp. CRB-9-2]|nr:hypothetical protein DL770_004593 [Monosporascus sp. CRB-9-2]
MDTESTPCLVGIEAGLRTHPSHHRSALSNAPDNEILSVIELLPREATTVTSSSLNGDRCLPRHPKITQDSSRVTAYRILTVAKTIEGKCLGHGALSRHKETEDSIRRAMVRKHYVYGLPEGHQEFDDGSKSKKRKRDICDEDEEGEGSDGSEAKKRAQPPREAKDERSSRLGHHESVRPSEQQSNNETWTARRSSRASKTRATPLFRRMRGLL